MSGADAMMDGHKLETYENKIILCIDSELSATLPAHYCFSSLSHSGAKLSLNLSDTQAMNCNTQLTAIFTLLAECHHLVPHYATNASPCQARTQAVLSGSDVEKVLMCPLMKRLQVLLHNCDGMMFFLIPKGERGRGKGY